MCCEDVQERLEGVIEHDLVVLPRVNWPKLDRLVWRGMACALALPPRMEFEVVVKRYLFLPSLWDKGYPNIDFEFSPSGFRNFEGRFVDIWGDRGRLFGFREITGILFKSVVSLLRTLFWYVSCNLNVTRLMK